MEKERLEQVLDRLINWCLDVVGEDSETVGDMSYAMRLNDEEVKELELDGYLGDAEFEDKAFEELNFQLGRKFKSATLWDGDDPYIEVRYSEEVEDVEDLVKSMGYEINEDQTGWCEGSDYEAYYIWLKSRG